MLAGLQFLNTLERGRVTENHKLFALWKLYGAYSAILFILDSTYGGHRDGAKVKDEQ